MYEPLAGVYANLLGALARMCTATVSALHFDAVLEIGACGPPSRIRTLESFVPGPVGGRSVSDGGPSNDAAESEQRSNQRPTIRNRSCLLARRDPRGCRLEATYPDMFNNASLTCNAW